MPDRHIFSDVITALARSRKGSRNAEKVLGLLDSLKELHAETEADALQPNAVVYGAALHALSAMKGDQQAIDKMEEMMNEMRENSIEPNNVCYNSLISAYAATGRSFKVEERLLIVKSFENSATNLLKRNSTKKNVGQMAARKQPAALLTTGRKSLARTLRFICCLSTREATFSTTQGADVRY